MSRTTGYKIWINCICIIKEKQQSDSLTVDTHNVVFKIHQTVNVTPLSQLKHSSHALMGLGSLPLSRLTCLWGEEAAGGADTLTQTLNLWFGLWAQRHRQEVGEVDWMSLTLGQAGQAAARRLQTFLL